MIGRDYQDRIQEEVKAIESKKVLLGFMNKVPALQQLKLADSLRNPLDPTLNEEEIAEWEEEKEEEFTEVWKEAKSNVESPPGPISSDRVDLRELPGNDEISQYVNAFQNQPYFEKLISHHTPDDWSIKLVPLESIIAMQPSVTTTAYEDIPDTAEPLLPVLRFCLPMRGNKYIIQQQIQENNRLGVRFISRGPNIDISAMNTERDPDTDDIDVTFRISPNINCVQVVEYGNRYLLKNGYHRCYKLMESGITHVPAFVCSVGNWQETGGANQGMFQRDLVFGQRPPMLADYFTEAAVELDKAGSNKMIEVMSETAYIRR